jgi:hypothetical protein
MLHIVQVEEIQQTLMRVPTIVRLLEKAEPGFVEAVKQWMTGLEKQLTDSHLAVVANVSALRTILKSAEMGIVPAGLVPTGRVNPRKVKSAAGALVLRHAVDLTTEALKEPMGRMTEGDQLARRIVAAARRKGLVNADCPLEDHEQMLKSLWCALGADGELGGAATHLSGLVGSYDALILIDRALSVTG